MEERARFKISVINEFLEGDDGVLNFEFKEPKTLDDAILSAAKKVRERQGWPERGSRFFVYQAFGDGWHPVSHKEVNFVLSKLQISI